jgi:uncharacterized membrane protein
LKSAKVNIDKWRIDLLSAGPTQLHQYYFWIGLVLCSIYLTLTPPIQSPDEQNHFFRAWHVSEGNLFAEKTVDNRLGGKLPKSIKEQTDLFLKLKNCDTCKVTIQECLNFIGSDIEPSNVEFIDFANTGFYPSINYLPQAIGIKFAGLISEKVGLAFYFARLFNALCWLLLTTLALKIAPAFKWHLLLLLLLPASLAFHISVNQDLIVHGLGFIFIAVLIKYAISEQQRTWKDYALISVLLAVLVTMKPTLIPLCLCILLVTDKIKWTKRIALLVVFSILPLFAFLISSYISSYLFIPYDQYDPEARIGQTLNPGVNPDAQLNHILKHPISSLWIFIKSLALSLPSTAAHYLGKFGWMANYLPGWLIALLAICILLITQTVVNSLRQRQRFILLATLAILVLVFCISMYMLWVPVGHPELWNIQGRYFILFIPILLLCVPNILKIKSGWASIFVLSVLIVSHIWMIIDMLGTYWM